MLANFCPTALHNVQQNKFSVRELFGHPVQSVLSENSRTLGKLKNTQFKVACSVSWIHCLKSLVCVTVSVNHAKANSRINSFPSCWHVGREFATGRHRHCLGYYTKRRF